MAGQRKALWVAAQIAVATLVVWLAWRGLAPHWGDVTAAFRTVSFRWGPMALSCAIVLFSYAVLIETWRRVVMAWGSQLSFGVAARIWFVSNLGKYIPGKIWAISAMGAMAHAAGVSPTAAVGSSLLIAVVNVLAGFAVIFFCAGNALGLSAPAMIVIGAAVALTALTPRTLPTLARRVGLMFGRDVTWPGFPHSTVVIAYAGCTAAWLLYGVAFQLMTYATLGDAGGATRYYITVFVASYLAGYLFLLAPGGIGVREGLLAALLQQFRLATVANAALLIVVSRVWLTLLELIPGLIFLAFVPKRPTTPLPNDVSSTR